MENIISMAWSRVSKGEDKEINFLIFHILLNNFTFVNSSIINYYYYIIILIIPICICQFINKLNKVLWFASTFKKQVPKISSHIWYASYYCLIFPFNLYFFSSLLSFLSSTKIRFLLNIFRKFINVYYFRIIFFKLHQLPNFFFPYSFSFYSISFD